MWRAPIDATDGEMIVIEGMHSGDLDGDGIPDLLVLRSTYATDRIDLITEMRDPADDSIRWSEVRSIPPDEATIRAFTPLELDGRPGGLLAEVSIDIEIVEGSGSSPSEVTVTLLGGGSFVRL